MLKKKLTYYFQIAFKQMAWEDINASTKEVTDRNEAVKWAKYLSSINGGKEVRMTDNFKLLQGSYFKAPCLVKQIQKKQVKA